MTNSKLKIKDLEFNDSTPKLLEDSNFYNDWPVVYVLNNKNEMYIGETYHAAERMKQHLKIPERQRMNEVHIIGCDDFTKSATLDIESSLIELCSSIENADRKLQNATNGIVKHNYANKKEFSQDSAIFTSVWTKLQDRGLVKGNIENLKNTDLFKYSPYKSLNAEQCTTRDYIVEDILDAFLCCENRCIFVNGSAGTGKTILAIYLLKLLVTNANYYNEDDESQTLPFVTIIKKIREIKPDLKIAYVVSMTSFRNTLKKVFSNIKGLKADMVIGPSEVLKEKYDILIVDEAHRLKRRKNLSSPGEYRNFDNNNIKLGLDEKGNQLDWILKQSQIQILLYDDKQSIKPTDISKEEFDKLKKDMHYHNLTSQMRCIGGADYIKYVDNLLNVKLDDYYDFCSRKYDFVMFESFNDFCRMIKEKEKNAGLSRIVSGYGFEWISKKGTNIKPNPRENEPDIVIEDKKLFWNRKEKSWPTSINGDRVVEEVGCIHTIQGYDLNYCGVIFGPEIDYYDNQIVIKKDQYYDDKGKIGIESSTELKQYIINIYKVLMTRGIKGTYIYVINKNLRQYFKQYIKIFKKDLNDR